MNKRGLSQVVTTVLIILVVLAAILIIWAAVRPTVETAGEQISADCITIELEAVSCSSDGNDTTVGIKRSAGSGELTDVKLVFSGGDVVDAGIAPGVLESDSVTIPGDYAAQTVNVAAVTGQGNVCPESSKAPVTCSAS